MHAQALLNPNFPNPHASPSSLLPAHLPSLQLETHHQQAARASHLPPRTQPNPLSITTSANSILLNPFSLYQLPRGLGRLHSASAGASKSDRSPQAPDPRRPEAASSRRGGPPSGARVFALSNQVPILCHSCCVSTCCHAPDRSRHWAPLLERWRLPCCLAFRLAVLGVKLRFLREFTSGFRCWRCDLACFGWFGWRLGPDWIDPVMRLGCGGLVWSELDFSPAAAVDSPAVFLCKSPDLDFVVHLPRHNC